MGVGLRHSCRSVQPPRHGLCQGGPPFLDQVLQQQQGNAWHHVCVGGWGGGGGSLTFTDVESTGWERMCCLRGGGKSDGQLRDM